MRVAKRYLGATARPRSEYEIDPIRMEDHRSNFYLNDFKLHHIHVPDGSETAPSIFCLLLHICAWARCWSEADCCRATASCRPNTTSLPPRRYGDRSRCMRRIRPFRLMHRVRLLCRSRSTGKAASINAAECAIILAAAAHRLHGDPSVQG